MVSNKSLDDRFMFSPDVNTTLINTDSELEKILSNLRHTKGCQAVRIGTARETILDPNTDPVCRLVTRILENEKLNPLSSMLLAITKAWKIIFTKDCARNSLYFKTILYEGKLWSLWNVPSLGRD